MHTFRTCRLGAVLLCAVLLSVLLLVPAAAAGDTLTLTGEISGMYEVPEGVTRVILSGVQAADFESGVKLPAAAEVVLADGTENVCGVMCMGDLRVTGGGSLVGGSGIYAFGDLTLDLTGRVLLEGGQIAAFGGSVTVNSGTYRLQSLPEGGGGLIVSSQGDVFLNGGDVKIYNDSVGVTSTDGAITVDKAELDISAADAVMVAQTITLPDGAQIVVQASDDQGSGQTIGADGEPARRMTLSASGAETSADAGEPVIQDGKTDAGDAVTLGARDPDAAVVEPETRSGGSNPALKWGLIAGGAGLIVLAAVLLLSKNEKKQSDHTKERRT